ncbi:unnamed protein product [Microthlaspi erraticum]|uniref:Reverse transcriptase domain-containing protein n=1 Tax=Microthlaspi erraticum TaxID=1685480 RepID=A0A6D2IGE5_9BRAS|nr:unnamed protein product [Microthlaspi erraticum]
MFGDATSKSPLGVFKNYHLKIGECIIQTDLTVMEMEEEKDLPLLLGTPFLNFDAEVEMLRKIRVEKMEVLVKCDEIASRLLSELGLPPLTPDPPIVPPPAFDPESVEKAVGKIGVADPHGSNITAPVSSDDTSLGVEQVSGETTVVGDGAGEPTQLDRAGSLCHLNLTY